MEIKELDDNKIKKYMDFIQNDINKVLVANKGWLVESYPCDTDGEYNPKGKRLRGVLLFSGDSRHGNEIITREVVHRFKFHKYDLIVTSDSDKPYLVLTCRV